MQPVDASLDASPRNAEVPRAEASRYLHGMVCPISHEAFRDPVVAEDGFSYERAAIARWLVHRASSPQTNAPMGARLLPNHALRSAVEEYTALLGQMTAATGRVVRDARERLSAPVYNVVAD